MSSQKEYFLEESAHIIAQLEEVIAEMKADGICLSAEIHRLANQLDRVWMTTMEDDD